MDIVTFEPDKFRLVYPMFEDKEKFSNELLTASFEAAEMKVYNGKCDNGVPFKMRQILLYMLTAHILTLRAEAINGDWHAGVLASASEGSVSIGMATPNITTRNAWYMRSPFGQEYWEMTAKFRSFRYDSLPSRPSWEGTNGRWWNLFG